LVSDPQGNLYGTAEAGGSGGGGVVFKVDPAGNETVLYDFTYYPFAGGAFPFGGVVRDPAGNLFGAAALGGANFAGVVFKVDPVTQVETVLYTFTGGSDGNGPWGNVILDQAGNVYGTTQGGGSAGGVVYKVDQQGNETVLHTFTGGTDGASPFYGVVRDAAGNLYGTTFLGGSANQGLVYKLDTANNYTILYSFTGGADGGSPASLLLGPEGNLYGTAGGGAYNHGVVFKLDPSTGQETVLHSFTGADGTGPFGYPLIADPNGHLYGTTTVGGTKAGGVVYRISAQ
jgi:uncharacterized repeat protein (TIGR03803 family)